MAARRDAFWRCARCIRLRGGSHVSHQPPKTASERRRGGRRRSLSRPGPQPAGSERQLRSQQSEDHRYAGVHGSRQLRLPDHPHRYEPGRLRTGRGSRRGREGNRAHPQGPHPGQESAADRWDPRQPAAVRRAGPHGRRLQRRGHGAARYRRQGLRRSGMAPGGAEVPRPHPLLLRYHRPQRPQDLRRAHAQAQEDGVHVFQDGPLHAHGEGPAGRGEQRTARPPRRA